MIYDINPVPAPRMTQSDRWKKRKCVLNYFSFRDRVKLLNISVEPYGDHIKFYMPMPKSWSKKKKKALDNTLHQQKPDVDNLLKALLDSIFESDAHIANVQVTKVWSYTGKIEIT